MRSTVLQDGEPAAGSLSINQAARRQRIVDTALALLEEREYERIQVKDVADGASVALGTVYHYFSSKEQLFGEVLVQWAGTLGTGISRRSLAGAGPASRLEDALHRSVRAFERRPQLAKLVARLEVSEDPFASDVLRRLDATTNQVYLTALEGLEPEKALTCGAGRRCCARQLASGVVGREAPDQRGVPLAQRCGRAAVAGQLSRPGLSGPVRTPLRSAPGSGPTVRGACRHRARCRRTGTGCRPRPRRRDCWPERHACAARCRR